MYNPGLNASQLYLDLLVLLMHIIRFPTKESSLQDINQVIQAINAEIRMSMLAEMTIPLIQQQHGCRPGRVSGSHVVNAISNLHGKEG